MHECKTVTLRTRPLKGRMMSFYLDYYPGYRDKETMKVIRHESLDKKYLLVGECKWTTQENGKQLTAELLRKANLLPFAKNYTIVPMLFLKNAPKDDAGNAMLPENVVELMK